MTSLPVSLTAAALLVLVPAGGALAQATNNTLSILQEGTGNRLTVDQSGATASRVGGLTIGTVPRPTGQLRLNGEVLIVPQAGEPAAGGVASFDPASIGTTVSRADPSNAAVQRGFGNVADVRITGTGGVVGLLQQNANGDSANTADVILGGDNGTALVSQIGSGNSSDLRVDGSGALGSILQNGNGNVADLSVSSIGGQGSLTQVGDNNNTTLAVTGAAGTSVSYTLVGSNVTSFNPAQGVDVISNAASVSITQSALTTR